jgi:hypothetical protein
MLHEFLWKWAYSYRPWCLFEQKLRYSKLGMESNNACLEASRRYRRGTAVAPTAVSAFPYQALEWCTSSDPQLRILHLFPASESGEAIVCRLTAVYADNRPPYEALSYSWGDAHDKRAITLNGYSFQVTSSLHCALKYLRYADRERQFWVDTVCINQNDTHEKNWMVWRMHPVYHQANRTLVWLGEESSDSCLAWDIICLVGKNGALYPSLAIKEELGKLLLPGMDATHETLKRWEALANLFGRPY